MNNNCQISSFAKKKSIKLQRPMNAELLYFALEV